MRKRKQNQKHVVTFAYAKVGKVAPPLLHVLAIYRAQCMAVIPEIAILPTRLQTQPADRRPSPMARLLTIRPIRLLIVRPLAVVTLPINTIAQ